jgi:uroporphyrinogen decarboxylase
MSTKLEDFHAILDGRADAPPFLTAAWQHFVGHEYDPHDFASTSVEFVRRWDWDWVKVNPRATYYAEAFGARYDPDRYAGVIPTLLHPAVASPTDLKGLRAITATENEVLNEQILAARLIKADLPDRAVVQTVFSPLSVLLQAAGLPLYPGDESATAGFTLAEMLDHHADETATALTAISDTLADYVTELLKPAAEGGAGLDGLFFAVTGTASAGFLDRARFDRFSRPYDLDVLAAAGGSAVVLHTCRGKSHPDWFADYPVSAVQWDQFLPGNPPVDVEQGHTPIGGPNATLFGPGHDVDEVSRQRAATVESRAGRPFLLAPSCTIPTPASDAALQRLRQG